MTIDHEVVMRPCTIGNNELYTFPARTRRVLLVACHVLSWGLK